MVKRERKIQRKKKRARGRGETGERKKEEIGRASCRERV